MRDSQSGPQGQDLYSLETLREWKQADAFRRAGIYGRAAKTFRQFWETHQDPEAGWRYANCLRKTGLVEPALSLLRDLAASLSEHPVVREELIWCLYEGRLVKEREAGRSAEVVAVAKEMLGLGAEGRALKLAVFAVISAAKTKGQWHMVSCWCDLLDPADLNAETRNAAKRSIPSDRER